MACTTDHAPQIQQLQVEAIALSTFHPEDPRACMGSASMASTCWDCMIPEPLQVAAYCDKCEEGVQLLAVCLLHDAACGRTFNGAPERTRNHLRNEGMLLPQRGKEGTTQMAKEALADQSRAEDWVA